MDDKYAYKILCNGKIFITDAENFMEAEDKFVENFGDKESFQVQSINNLDEYRNDDCVVFF